MPRINLAIVPFLFLAVLVLPACERGVQTSPPGSADSPQLVSLAAFGDVSISGPYEHGNLSVFLIHRKDARTDRNLITLEEGLARKTVIVHETGEVGELEIENLSDSEEVFIQAGEIVKGGRQDRILSVDVVLPPKSGKLPVSSFCVEQGRWQQRGGEKAECFESSQCMAIGNCLKIAALKEGNQGKVWKEVASAQEKLGSNLASPVVNADSETSLQLSLENSRLKEEKGRYIAALSGIAESRKDAIGLIYAVNGRMRCAEMYGSNALFTKLWRKNLEAAAVDAVMLKGESGGNIPTTAHKALAFLREAETSRLADSSDAKGLKRVTKESPDSFVFESEETAGEGARPIHMNILAKE